MLRAAAEAERWAPDAAAWMRGHISDHASANEARACVRYALVGYYPPEAPHDAPDGWGRLPRELRGTLMAESSPTLAEFERTANHESGWRPSRQGPASASPTPTPQPDRQPAPVAPQEKTKMDQHQKATVRAETNLARIEPRSQMGRPSDFGDEHRAVVKDAYCSGATDIEFEILWRGAVSRGLDPVRKQIYFVSRYDEAKGKSAWSSQVSIDGFRAIAEATGQYDGQDEATYEREPEEGYLIARVAVYRKGRRPSVGVARWPEFVQTVKGGGEAFMWKKMPYHMLAKCAEALALRKAFPEDLSGLYTPDEMGSSALTDAERAEAITVEAVAATEEDIAAARTKLLAACLPIAQRKDADAYRATLEAFRAWCEGSGVAVERCRAEIRAVKATIAKAVGTVGDAATPSEGEPGDVTGAAA